MVGNKNVIPVKSLKNFRKMFKIIKNTIKNAVKNLYTKNSNEIYNQSAERSSDHQNKTSKEVRKTETSKTTPKHRATWMLCADDKWIVAVPCNRGMLANCFAVANNVWFSFSVRHSKSGFGTAGLGVEYSTNEFFDCEIERKWTKK